VSTFATTDFRLQSGVVLPSVTIAYRTLGVLAPDRGNAVLITHGNTSGPQMIDPGGSTVEGSWNEIVGPGKAVDTNRLFAICPNMLGSSYGSTNATDIDPATGKPNGSNCPISR
jgi:homoserine O-acetyltransferase